MTNDNMNTKTPSQQALLMHEAIELLMEQAQVFASAWSLIGSQFDKGNALADAEAEKKKLYDMLKEFKFNSGSGSKGIDYSKLFLR